MRRPRLNTLRTFEAAGRHLSFAKAADELNISPPAVSQQMRQLEAHLKAGLFVRGRHLALTSTGRAYLEAVHEALERLDSITDQLFPQRHHRTVTIRCTPSVATLWLAPRLGAFHEAYPDIQLIIRTLDQELPERSASGADLEILIGASEAPTGHAQKLLTATVVPVCAPGLLPVGGRLTAPADILEYELVHVLGYDDDWHRWFRRHGLKGVGVPPGLTVDGSLIAMEAAQRGDGIALGRRPFIDAFLDAGELMEAFTEAYHLHTDYYLRQSAPIEGRRAGERVADWLVELAARRATHCP